MALSPQLDVDLQKLAASIEMAAGEFTLIFAQCNYVLLQEQLAERLKALTDITTLRLKSHQHSLTEILERLRRRHGQLPPAVQVLGMEKMTDLQRGLAKIDQTRDQLEACFPLPIVVWVNDDLQTAWIRHAPNMESWGVPKGFTLDDQTVVELIALKVQQVMSRGWQLSTQEAQFLSLELTKAAARLQAQSLGEATQAHLAALQGLTAEQLGDADFQHYQSALGYEGGWSAVERALLLRNCAWCGLRRGLDTEQIGAWLDEARAGLVNSAWWAASLPGLALTAWRLEDWPRLEALVADETSLVALTYQALIAWQQ